MVPLPRVQEYLFEHLGSLLSSAVAQTGAERTATIRCVQWQRERETLIHLVRLVPVQLPRLCQAMLCSIPSHTPLSALS